MIKINVMEFEFNLGFNMTQYELSKWNKYDASEIVNIFYIIYWAIRKQNVNYEAQNVVFQMQAKNPDTDTIKYSIRRFSETEYEVIIEECE